MSSLNETTLFSDSIISIVVIDWTRPSISLVAFNLLPIRVERNRPEFCLIFPRSSSYLNSRRVDEFYVIYKFLPSFAHVVFSLFFFSHSFIRMEKSYGGNRKKKSDGTCSRLSTRADDLFTAASP